MFGILRWVQMKWILLHRRLAWSELTWPGLVWSGSLCKRIYLRNLHIIGILTIGSWALCSLHECRTCEWVRDLDSGFPLSDNLPLSAVRFAVKGQRLRRPPSSNTKCRRWAQWKRSSRAAGWLLLYLHILHCSIPCRSMSFHAILLFYSGSMPFSDHLPFTCCPPLSLL